MVLDCFNVWEISGVLSDLPNVRYVATVSILMPLRIVAFGKEVHIYHSDKWAWGVVIIETTILF